MPLLMMGRFSRQSQIQNIVAHTHCIWDKLSVLLAAELSHNIDMPSILIMSLIMFLTIITWFVLGPQRYSVQEKGTSVPITSHETLQKRAKKELPQPVLFKINTTPKCSVFLLKSLRKGSHRDLPCSGLTVPYCLSILYLQN